MLQQNGTYLSYLYNSGTHNSSHGLNVQIATSNIAAYGLRVNTGGDSNALAVMGNGTVGIGTNSPNAKLEVASGQAKTVTSGVQFARFGTSNEASNYATLTCEVKGAAAAANRKWIFQTIENGVANAGNIVFQPSGGNIGIGTDSPDDKLQIGQGHSILVGDFFQLGSGSSDIMGAFGLE